MSFKKTLYTSCAVLGLSMPLFAFASVNDLTIVNDTNRDSTCVTNKGFCSTIIDGGVTKAHSTNTITADKINKACALNKKDCKADVYMTNNCTGPIVAVIIFDTNSGIKSVDLKDQSYTIKASGFNISMSGGPSLVAKK